MISWSQNRRFTSLRMIKFFQRRRRLRVRKNNCRNHLKKISTKPI